MMEAVFLKILNMSIAASWLVLAVLIVRLLMKKAPKWVAVLMWGLVAIRLVSPFSLESVFSLIPSAETVPGDILSSANPAIHSGISPLNSFINPILSNSFGPGASILPMEGILLVVSIIWVIGIAAMAMYMAISYSSLRRKVREAVPYTGNIRLCDRVDTPFILGVIRPKLYLPSSINEQDIKYVLAHENAHLKRHDHWWKPMGFLLLTVYWFNPLLWVAYWLLCRDIELACDERVINDMGAENKKNYSDALINCSVPRKIIAACPLAFGEVGVKERVKSVLNYKKPAFWLIIVAVISCIAVAVCFLTNPKDTGRRPDMELLRELYPDFADLNTENGLDVYVAQMATNHYTFSLLPHGHAKPTFQELFHLPGVRLAEMQQILAAYAVDKSDIYIVPYQIPWSSYICEYFIWVVGDDKRENQARYINNIKNMLFAD